MVEFGAYLSKNPRRAILGADLPGTSRVGNLPGSSQPTVRSKMSQSGLSLPKEYAFYSPAAELSETCLPRIYRKGSSPRRSFLESPPGELTRDLPGICRVSSLPGSGIVRWNLVDRPSSDQVLPDLPGSCPAVAQRLPVVIPAYPRDLADTSRLYTAKY